VRAKHTGDEYALQPLLVNSLLEPASGRIITIIVSRGKPKALISQGVKILNLISESGHMALWSACLKDLQVTSFAFVSLLTSTLNEKRTVGG
jgi:hypothetical protein